MSKFSPKIRNQSATPKTHEYRVSFNMTDFWIFLVTILSGIFGLLDGEEYEYAKNGSSNLKKT